MLKLPTDDEIKSFNFVSVGELEKGVLVGVGVGGNMGDLQTLGALFVWWLHKDYLVEKSKQRRANGFKQASKKIFEFFSAQAQGDKETSRKLVDDLKELKRSHPMWYREIFMDLRALRLVNEDYI